MISDEKEPFINRYTTFGNSRWTFPGDPWTFPSEPETSSTVGVSKKLCHSIMVW